MNQKGILYFRHIDGLRAIAVIVVFLAHLGFEQVAGGFVGVDVFFVISGYLITRVLLKELEETGRLDFIDFYFRRVKRILPALIITLFVSFLLAIWLFDLAKFPVFGGTVAAAAMSVSNVYLYRQAGYFDIFSKSNPLLNTWSLGVEEQFYIVWPVMLLLAWRFGRSKRAMLSVVLIVMVSSFSMNLLRSSQNPTGLYYLAHYRAFELCAGALLLWMPKLSVLNTAWGREIGTLIGFCLVGWALFTYNSQTVFPSYNAIAPIAGAMLLIYCGSAKYFGYPLRNPAVVFIGLISYSLYLVHWPLIVFWSTYNEDIGSGYFLTSWQKIVVFFMAIFIASFMWRFVESPVRSQNFTTRGHKMRFIFAWCTGIACMAGIGYSVYAGNGWLWRVNAPSSIKSAASVASYHMDHWGGASFNGGAIYTGSDVAPRIVMMGDSHSGMLDAGIVTQIAKPYDLSVFTVSGGGAGKYYSSLLLPGSTRLTKDQDAADRSSLDAVPEMLRELEKSSNSILIYSASYIYQIPDSGDLYTKKSWGINIATASEFAAYAPFIEALDRLRILIGNHALVIIGDVPGSPSYSGMRCLAPLRWFSENGCRQSQLRQDNKAALRVNRILKLYAEAHQNVYFVDPYDALCDRVVCMNVAPNGEPLYSDGSHLSIVGSNYVIGKLRKRLIGILGGGSGPRHGDVDGA
ncbi:hypothetical protein CCAE64S_01510 [Castellaniella caeni]